MHLAKYTPGPWTQEFEIDGVRTFTRVKAHGVALATTAPQCGRPHHREEAEANARLIASAPDMLEALKAVLTWSDQANPAGYGGLFQGLETKVRAAIAKAVGAPIEQPS
jgi:hypothetical protein